MPLNLAPFGKYGRSLLGDPAIPPHLWQYQPTETSHDPNPPLTLSEGSSPLTLTPDPVAATSAVPAPTLAHALALTPDATASTSAAPAPTLVLALALAPDPVAATPDVPQPTVTVDGGPVTLTPDPVVVTAAVMESMAALASVLATPGGGISTRTAYRKSRVMVGVSVSAVAEMPSRGKGAPAMMAVVSVSAFASAPLIGSYDDDEAFGEVLVAFFAQRSRL